MQFRSLFLSRESGKESRSRGSQRKRRRSSSASAFDDSFEGIRSRSRSRSNSRSRSRSNSKSSIEVEESGGGRRIRSLSPKLEKVPGWAIRRLNRIKQIVDRMASKINATEINVNNNEASFEVLEEKLLAIEKFLMVKETMIGLKECVDDFQAALGGNAGQVEDTGLAGGIAAAKEQYIDCKSIEDLERLGDFEYNAEKGAVLCLACSCIAAHFGSELEDTFYGKIQSREFRNMKKSLKRHLTTPKHIESVNKEEVKEKMEVKLASREKKIRLTIGDVCYYLLKNGRPYTDFPTILVVLSRAGVDIGDLNHGVKFVQLLRPVCAEVIDKRLTNFFHSIMPQTGRRPVAKVLADKGTWKHATRMICGMFTVVPDSEEPLQAIFVSCNVCPGSSGDAQTTSLVKSVEKYLQPEQYLGLCADGATLRCNVGKKLSQHFGQIGQDDYDLMHKAGRVEEYMRRVFKFILEHIEIVSAIYRMVG